MECDDPTLFQGIRFYLAGFKALIYHQVKTVLVSCGGVYVADYCSDCTHVIVDNLLLDDPICVAARRDGKALVTSLWVDHSLNALELANTSSIMYRPQKELNGIPGAGKLVICLTGYFRLERENIMMIVDLMGAEFSKKLVPGKITHLVCYKFEGAKYEVAKKLPTVKLVNHQWLEDCLKTWKILPENHYSKSYELEMMDAIVQDSEEETQDNTTRVTYWRVMNGIPTVHNETGNALDNLVNNVSTPSIHRLSNNVGKDEVSFSLKPEQVPESRNIHNINKHLPVHLNNDEQNMRYTPVKSGLPLDVGREFGNLSAPKSKRSADSLYDYSCPLNSRKTAKIANVSEGKSGGSNRKLEYLELDDAQISNLEVDKMKVSTSVGRLNFEGPSSARGSISSLQSARLITPEGKVQHLADKVIADVAGCNIESDKKISASELFEVPSHETVSSGVEGQHSLPQLKQLSERSDVSLITTKSQKLMATASKRIIASEPATSIYSPLQKSTNSNVIISGQKGTETVKTSKDKSSTDVPSTSSVFEKLQTSISSKKDCRTSSITGNVVSCGSSSVTNKKTNPHILPGNTSFSPELKKLEVSKARSSKLNSDDQSGGSALKTPRKKMVARKTLGSRPKVSNKASDAQKGFLNENFGKDVALDFTGQIEGKNHANPSVTDNVMAPQNSTADINEYGELFNDATEDIPDFAVQYQNSETESSYLLNSINRTSRVLPRETHEAEMTNSPSVNAYQRMEDGKQILEQKKGISGRAKGKTVTSAPKEVIQDLRDDVGGKASENKDSLKEQTESPTGKKRLRGRLVKGAVQIENKTVAADDLGECIGGKLGNSALKKRRGTPLLKKPDTLVEVEKGNESTFDKDGQHDGDKQPEKLSSASCSSEVVMEVENEARCAKNGGKQTGKKNRGTPLLTKTTGLTTVGKENLPVNGKFWKLSGKPNGSIVGGDQGGMKGKKGGTKKSGTVEVENENEHIFHYDEVIEGKGPKSKLAVTENKAISSDSKIIQSDLTVVKNEPTCFIVCGHRLQRREFQQLIKCLKGKHCRDSHQWSYQATHFIVPDPIRRTEKFFAAASSGRWILKTDYLAASIQAGKFLSETPYEWHKNSLTEDGAISLEAPRKWRLLREKTGHGAFYGMRVVIYGECIAPSLETLKRAVKAGDGTILATSPPYTRFLNSGIDFAIVTPGMPQVDIWIQEFLKHEIPCVSADYLVEYVCKPGYPLDRHVQYNTREWAAKSFARLSSLSIDSVGDAATPDNQVSDSLACEVCGCSDRAEVMLVCGDESGSTGCGVGTHIDCCDPALEDVPDEDWFCPKCIESKTKSRPLASAKKKAVSKPR